MKNKIIIVIGGTGGIGFEICKMLFKKGYLTYLVGRDKKDAEKKAKVIDRNSDSVFFESLDVMNEDAVETIFKTIYKKHSSIYAVINLAGIFEPFGEFEKVNLTQHRKVVEVNLFGSFNIVHAILPFFKKQNAGKIILFSGGGVGGDMPLLNASSYYVSKSAVSVFTEVLAKEIEKDNVQINAVLPGQILTKSTKKTFKISSEKLGPVLTAATDNLMKTGGNSSAPVLALVEFLLSDKSNHVSGRTLSAKWDNLNLLEKDISDERFKLRRIDGKVYKKVKP